MTAPFSGEWIRGEEHESMMNFMHPSGIHIKIDGHGLWRYKKDFERWFVEHLKVWPHPECKETSDKKDDEQHRVDRYDRLMDIDPADAVTEACKKLAEIIEEITPAFIEEDPRKAGLKDGLRQLSSEQILKVLNWSGQMVLDEYNYHQGCFCPLAVGIGLAESMVDPTNEKVTAELLNRGYKIYNTRGIKGEFYTTDRLRDLKIAAVEVLKEKNWTPSPGDDFPWYCFCGL